MNRLKVGQTASRSRIFTIEDVVAYRQLTGDRGLDFANISNAKEQIIPGPLLGGMISEILGTSLPGRGTNWLKQRYEFLKPAFVGTKINSEVEITRLSPQKSLINLRSTITNEVGEILCQGESLVLLRDSDRN